MKKLNKDNIDLIIEYYRQFIRLTQGEAALNKIDNYIEDKLHKRSTEIPEKNNTFLANVSFDNNTFLANVSFDNNKAILEKGILDNV